MYHYVYIYINMDRYKMDQHGTNTQSKIVSQDSTQQILRMSKKSRLYKTTLQNSKKDCNQFSNLNKCSSRRGVCVCVIRQLSCS